MKKKMARDVVLAVCVAFMLVLGVGCGKAQGSGNGGDDVGSESAAANGSELDQSDPMADGRIDVSTTGVQTATYHGAKYIVSDVTVDQRTGDGLTEGLGLQEICVIDQPAAWEHIGSIGWDRNSISYSKIQTPWGTASYRYEYINEASGAQGDEGRSRTSEDGYFNGHEGVEHAEVGDHSVAYVFEDLASMDSSMGIPDLEAMGEGEEGGATYREVAVYTFEQRDDKCAFTVTVTCQVTDEDAFDLTAEDIVREVYEPLTFEPKGATVDAASFVSDVTLTNADGSEELVLRREGDSLMNYAEHSVMLLAESQGVDVLASATYDFAPEGSAPEDAEQYDIDGRNVMVEVERQLLVAWTDVNGSPLRIEANMFDGEDVEATLERVAAGRIEA